MTSPRVRLLREAYGATKLLLLRELCLRLPRAYLRLTPTYQAGAGLRHGHGWDLGTEWADGQANRKAIKAANWRS